MLGSRERRVERWALIRCLRLLSASLWLLHVSDLEAELTIESPPPIKLTKLIDGQFCLSKAKRIRNSLHSDFVRSPKHKEIKRKF